MEKTFVSSKFNASTKCFKVIVWLIMRPMIRNLNKEESPECHTEEKNVKNIGMNL